MYNDTAEQQLTVARRRMHELEAALRAAQGEVQALKANREFSRLLAAGVGRDLSPVV